MVTCRELNKKIADSALQIIGANFRALASNGFIKNKTENPSGTIAPGLSKLWEKRHRNHKLRNLNLQQLRTSRPYSCCRKELPDHGKEDELPPKRARKHKNHDHKEEKSCSKNCSEGTEDKYSKNSTTAITKKGRQRKVSKPPVETQKPLLEAYQNGAWWDVEILQAKEGKFSVHFVGYENDEIPSEFLRLRVRMADAHDCEHFLRPNMDISVFGLHPHVLIPGTSLNEAPAWYDAKLISILRKPHKSRCSCTFIVQFFCASKQDVAQSKTRPLVPGNEEKVGIESIGILQKPFSSDFKTVLKEMQLCQSTSPSRMWSTDTRSLHRPVFSHELSKARSIDLRHLSNRSENTCANLNLEKEAGETQNKRDAHQKDLDDPQSCPFEASTKKKGRPEKYASKTAPETKEMQEGAVTDKSDQEYDSSVSEKLPMWDSSSESEERFEDHSSSESEEIVNNAALHTAGNLNVKNPKKQLDKKIDNLENAQEKGEDDISEALSLVSRLVNKEGNLYGNSEEVCCSRNPENFKADCSEKRQLTGRKRENNDSLTNHSKGNRNKHLSTSKALEPQNSAVTETKKRHRPPSSTQIAQTCVATPRKRKRKKRPSAVPANKNCREEKPEELEDIALIGAQWPFHDFFQTLSKEPESLERTDWSKLPPPEKNNEEIQWDPIVFHEQTIDVKERKKEDPYEQLWQDMDLALYKAPIHVGGPANARFMKSQQNTFSCESHHNFILDDEEGLVCGFCGLVGLDVKSMLPPLLSYRSNRKRYKRIRDAEESEEEDEEEEEDLEEKEEEEEEEDEDDEEEQEEEEGKRQIKMKSRRKEEPGKKKMLPSLSTKMYTRISRKQSTVWSLIPDLEEQMHKHQKDGFEFLWRNIAGGLGPDAKRPFGLQETGGCIVSHAPGTGKSLLIISFLKSFLQMHPKCKPLIVAPKIMLRPWEREFRKWEVDIPVYILNSSKDYGKKKVFSEHKDSEMAVFASGAKIPIERFREFHRMLMISQWQKKASVLAVSYSLFSLLTDEDNPEATEESKKMGKVLLQSTGLLILDEGHFPRNHDSKIRKSLMRVKTPSRILLSGTIFQNNCRELFNTFYLVRPTFMKDLSESQKRLDQMNKENMTPSERSKPRSNRIRFKLKIFRRGERRSSRLVEIQNRAVEDSAKATKNEILIEEEIEARNRKLFMDKIGSKLENGQRKRGRSLENAIKKLRSMTDSFVHYYAGEVLKCLPGLKDFTVMLKASPLQEDLLNEVAKSWDCFNALELEFVVSTICIHPFLFRNLSFADRYGKINVAGLQESRKDPDKGVKVKFVMDLVQLCQVTNEKVLIFSQNIQPLELLEEMFQSCLQLYKGQHVVKLDGKLNLDERQNIIDQFNQSDGSVRVLLASIRACGEGVTLTGASRVVFLDIVWNPAVMKQAMSRAFRLGQKRIVYVYRLVVSGTMEEDKYKRIVWKDWLSRSISVSSSHDNKSKRFSSNNGKEAHVQSGVSCFKMGSPTLSMAYEDSILSKLHDQNQYGNTLLRIVKHDICLDQGDFNCDGEIEE